MRLQTAALRKGLFAQIALVRPDSCMSARVPLQVERVIKALSAERAQVPFDVRVALHVPVQQTLQVKGLRADAADKLVRVVLGNRSRRRRLLLLLVVTHPVAVRILNRQRILNTVSSVHKLQLHFRGQTQLKEKE